MKYRFFQIPVQDPDGVTEDLNRLLGQYRTLSVDRHLVAGRRRVRCADHPRAAPAFAGAARTIFAGGHQAWRVQRSAQRTLRWADPGSKVPRNRRSTASPHATQAPGG